MIKLVGFCISTFFLCSACMSAKVYTTGTPLTRTPDYSSWDHFFIWGLLPVETTHTSREVCKDPKAKIIQVETFSGPLGGILFAATSGLYSPIQVKVWCKKS